eukprot:6077991-Ditylum_brightwellii.AAC.1
MAPYYLCWKATMNIVRFIPLSTESSTALASVLANASLPDGTTIENCSTQQRQKVLDDPTYLIMCGDVIDDDEDFLLASDMRKLNCCGNREGSQFKKFWNAAERVIELDGSGAHHRCHDA